ncbi:MAG: hypothetical protein AB7P24_06820 [Nitrospira sp.]
MTDGFVVGKWVWTENDFEQMRWHDCWVHALAFDPEAAELLFDLDSLLKWINPGSEEKHFSFWSAPATLVFSEVENLKISLEPFLAFELDAISREEIRKLDTSGSSPASPNWTWTLDFFNGCISFNSTGFRQYIRKSPVFNTTGRLALDQRGGLSFERREGLDPSHKPT